MGGSGAVHRALGILPAHQPLIPVPVSFPRPLPVAGSAARAYALLWRHCLLHAKAIWPPVLFLVAAEFLYHRIVGNAHGLAAMWQATLAAPWYMPLGAAVAWLAGLKFLLSFSISWRRHLLLGERFDPFFFKAPFWRYLGFLLLTYAWLLALAVLATLCAGLLAAALGHGWAIGALVLAGLPAAALALWAIIRQVPFFTVLALGASRPGWRDAVRAMRGSGWRYLVAFVLAMLPIAILNLLLDTLLTRIGADRHAVPVALGEAAFRQAMLFLHFSLGASLGAIATTTLFPDLPDHAGAQPGSRLQPDATKR